MSTATRRIQLSAPWVDERDEELVLEVLRSGRLSLGPTGPRFERALADAVEAAHCAAVSSGTAAEVTPVRSVDDHELGVGPVTIALQSAYLDIVRGVDERWAQWREIVPSATPAA